METMEAEMANNNGMQWTNLRRHKFSGSHKANIGYCLLVAQQLHQWLVGFTQVYIMYTMICGKVKRATNGNTVTNHIPAEP